ncbi:MAG: DUF1571 domain-containing protein [Syntrophales bacterium]|jgi:hypothetical protein|nr:DUF1571 domain-containing protein [Syntrophales bacterium]MCK9527617.1 DUF1571 domain-containing protein [Syntrophales bacterium]MDX9922234.1 DUF1571 domain-containing protein [Syntrophales bacterium]
MRIILAIIVILALGAPFPGGAVEMKQGQVEDQDFIIESLDGLISKARIRMENVTDYSCTIYKREYIKGRLLPLEIIEIKFMRPFSLYMKWVEGRLQGRELICRKGWNDNKIMVHDGGRFKKKFVVNIDPDSAMAMKDNRHSVHEMDIGYVINLFARDIMIIKEDPARETIVTNLGMRVVYGQESMCFETIMPKDRYPELYARKTFVCYDIHESIPTWVQVWDIEDGILRLVEDYRYADVRLNRGLTPWDFDPQNPDYEFVRRAWRTAP